MTSEVGKMKDKVFAVLYGLDQISIMGIKMLSDVTRKLWEYFMGFYTATPVEKCSCSM